MEPVDTDVVSERLGSLQKTMDEVKDDVRQIKDGAPIWRIEQLEKRNDRLSAVMWTFVVAMTVAMIGAYLTSYLTR